MKERQGCLHIDIILLTISQCNWYSLGAITSHNQSASDRLICRGKGEGFTYGFHTIVVPLARFCKTGHLRRSTTTTRFKHVEPPSDKFVCNLNTMSGRNYSMNKHLVNCSGTAACHADWSTNKNEQVRLQSGPSSCFKAGSKRRHINIHSLKRQQRI
jgi:hypothetical protein